MSQLNLKQPTSSFLPSTQATNKGLLQRKCDCGNHSSGGECETCSKKKLQRKLSVGTTNDPMEKEADRVAGQVVAGAAVGAVSSFRAPLVQRDGPAADTKTDEEKYKEGGKKILEAFLETSVGKQLTEDAKKAMFDNWYGRIITGTTAVGTITALAAAEKELPAQLPEIPLDFLKPGMSVKLEYNGPVNKPTSASLTFTFKEQGSAKKKPTEKFPELAPIRQAEKMFPAPQPTGGPDQKFWDQYQLQEIQKRLPSLKPNQLQTPEKKSPFQLTPPEFGAGYGYKPPSLFGDQFKLKLDGDKKKKEEDKVQKKARVGTSNDPLEAEADVVAEQVLSQSTEPSRVTPTGASIQRASQLASETESEAPGSVDQAIAGSGKPLDSSTLGFMESRFGQDFSQVRIHTDSTAAESARDVDAQAYTLGNNIVFGAGQYNPHSQSGKRLLAHELTHVLQQAGGGQQTLRRCANPKKNDPIYDKYAVDIKKLPNYTSLPDKTFADEILVKAKTKNDCLYLLGKLKDLFQAKEKNVATITAETQASTVAETTKEAARVAKPQAAKDLNVEEKLSADPARTWVKIKGKFGGGTYQVDRTNPKNIVVKAKVFLKAAGTGQPADVANIKSMEDGIEKAASMKGFTVDIEFVNAPDAETFTAEVRPGEWEDATNWSGGSPTGFAHELLHMFAFEVDRYNYIDSHSTNTSMVVNERLRWFLKQLDKPAGFDNDKSIMGYGEHPLDDDACTVAGLDKATCVGARRKP